MVKYVVTLKRGGNIFRGRQGGISYIYPFVIHPFTIQCQLVGSNCYEMSCSFSKKNYNTLSWYMFKKRWDIEIELKSIPSILLNS